MTVNVFLLTVEHKMEFNKSKYNKSSPKLSGYQPNGKGQI